MLWSADELVAASGGKMTSPFDAGGISIDSRAITPSPKGPGDLFIALKAERDGHEFVRAALDAGAAGAMVSHIPSGCENAPLLLVDDVEEALRSLGHFARTRTGAKIVAVTGSAGKTSTKEMLRTVLGTFAQTHAAEKSFNNHWGVPLTLARMPKEAEFGVFEIGMNHPGEIAPLSRQTRPDLALITNVAPVHLAGFSHESEIAREKASIFDGLGENGLGIANGDLEHRDIIASHSNQRILWFGRGENNDIRLRDAMAGDGYSQGSFTLNGQSHQLRINVSGVHHLMNALAVIGVVDQFGLDIARAINALEKWEAPEGRGQILKIPYKGGMLRIVDESYNANPLSMRAALEAFAKKQAGRRVAILGDMRELGPNSLDFHRRLGDIDAVHELDHVHVVGEDMRALREALDHMGTAPKGRYFSDIKALLAALEEIIQPEDAILLKGSNAIGLAQAVDGLTRLGQRNTNTQSE